MSHHNNEVVVGLNGSGLATTAEDPHVKVSKRGNDIYGNNAIDEADPPPSRDSQRGDAGPASLVKALPLMPPMSDERKRQDHHAPEAGESSRPHEGCTSASHGV